MFKNGVELPLHGYDTKLDICREYKQQLAGGPTRKKTKTSPKVPKKSQISSRLAQCLISHQIKSVGAIGYKHNNKWYIVTSLKRTNQVEQVEEDSDYLIELNNPTFSQFSNKLMAKLNAEE